jgi:antirestriction protein ArdC
MSDVLRNGSSAVVLDIYELVTPRILDLLEQGTVPWNSPSIARVGFPRIFSTGKPYSSSNRPCSSPTSRRRITDGQVRKGEKGFSRGEARDVAEIFGTLSPYQ